MFREILFILKKQFGFRSKHNTIDALVELTETVHNNIQP